MKVPEYVFCREDGSIYGGGRSRMPHRRRKTRSHFIGGLTIALVSLILIGGATYAAVKLVFGPASHAGRAVPAGVSSAASGPPSSKGAASSGAASASSSEAVAGKPGGYGYFSDAVFIGDSLTEGISIYSVAKNAGVFASNGMSTVSALTKTVSVGGKSLTVPDAVSSIKPAKVYILLGSNDMSWMSQSTFISNYGKLIDALKAGTPGAKYYIQSIFPVTAAYEQSTGITNAKIGSFNTALAALCTQKGVSYVDAGGALKGADGKLTAAEASGGYNIKKSCYKTWFDYLTEHE